MTTVMAQGTFDILHPGHLHYLQESEKLGDDLCVVIGRDSRIKQRKDLCMDENARREVIESLRIVDQAVLGSNESIFDTVETIGPDIITLGNDQGFDIDQLESALTDHGFPEVEVVRISAYEPESSEFIVSSSKIKKQLKQTEKRNMEYGRGLDSC